MSAPPGEFAKVLADLDPPRLAAAGGRAGDAAVTSVLATARAGGRLGLSDLAVLLSPAATGRLEELARVARETTLRRFGRAVRLFAPLYVSNACLSSCTYCGFSKGLPVVRRTLSAGETETEARLLAERGFRHLLLVSGEHRVEVSADYLVEIVERLSPLFPAISIETQTWSDDTYARLVAAGLVGAVHYQETYDRARYREVHVAGWKRDFDRRLSSFDRAGAAGVRRLGVGVLLGLAVDWRADVLALAAHATFLSRRYWRTEVTAALPRIKPNAAGFPPVVVVDDAEFVQAHAALRLYEPDLDLSLSTREPAPMRDGLVRIAVTTMSAGSSTEPGGYGTPGSAQEQFSISDERPPDAVAAMLVEAGYDPVWKDAFPLVAGRS
ncbi:2-iminoacetate synthase ThiH [Frankia sp. CNm7]|uniref:2-iminoacetate synthase ThiH n=1 Tax=Frankia nepalensis TaxID=1836974 RepID=A0A937UQ99_9ACTN|nr:2-iminoacetate synthase ThiH [Frankia nepalensis]MBL7501145.1 2-iminoacetate synthase ThiH [Frankia nepalensis]MBL7513751.1 2-iminoacetate synthase ThiH [Frankia nepalensis]MBL7521090.1 2-iminoacetate synthase ThiH [Frankia nepalensis]MBL7631649.1 2-iminoacetate synthase ThiH [Frankia nepalensis]